MRQSDYAIAIELPTQEQWEAAIRIKERVLDGRLWGIAVASGIVAVAMVPRPESRNAILLPDDVKRQLAPDMGVVVDSGVSTIRVGDIVAVLHGHGVHIDGLGDGGWGPMDEVVAFYGAAGGSSPWGTAGRSRSMTFHRYNAEDVIMAHFIDHETLVPLGDSVLLEFHTPKQTDSGILLGDSTVPPDPIATVRAIGPRVTDVKVGDRVLFYTGSVTRILSCNKVIDLGFVPQSGILGVVQ